MPSATTKSTSSPRSMYSELRERLDEYGELMIRTDGGEVLELHKHNAEFEDEPFIKVDADDEVHWIDASRVGHFWIHDEI